MTPKKASRMKADQSTSSKLPTSSKSRIDVTKLLDQAANNPALTTRELGKLHGVSHVAVINLFKRYGITRERVEEYKTNRAELMAGVQEIVLSTLTEDEIKKASLKDRTMLFGVLYDKERLERGQSTSNSHILLQAVMSTEDD